MTLSRLDLDGASGVSGVGVVQPGFQDSVNAEALNSVAQTHQQPVDWTNSFASTSQLIRELSQFAAGFPLRTTHEIDSLHYHSGSTFASKLSDSSGLQSALTDLS